MNQKKIIAMIPARIGSQRLKQKNLALLNGKPLISYTIEAAIESKVFSQIILNSDHEVFGEIAMRHGIEFYHRPDDLGSSLAKVDDVVYDFLNSFKTDYLAWVNPTSPLQTGEEIKNAVNYFLENKFDSFVTVKEEQVHCIYKDKPINFSIEEIFGQTQDLFPVSRFVYSIVAWKAKTFMEMFEEKKYAFFCGKTGYYPVSKETAIIIKTKEDLMLAEYILKSRAKGNGYEVKYDKLANKISLTGANK
ncbi:MAG: hypothetical protein ACD_79C00145G0001 [uncultured bacterium]|nr:MAG: hypothetical protein ACD_79C00145G0001 [uncultured bacterium]